MTAENTVGLIVAVALLGHLVRALLHPHNGSAFAGRAADTAHISPAYAELQVRRVAARNHLDAERVAELVAHHTEGRTLGFVGEPRVNVLRLNIALREPADAR